MTAAHPASPSEPGRFNREFSNLVIEQDFHELAERTATGAQNLRDAGELTAMELRDPTLNPDALIDRELKIKEMAADLVEKGTHSPEEADAFIRGVYTRLEEKIAQDQKARYEAEAAALERLGASLGAGLRRYAGVSPAAGTNPEKTKPGIFDRLRQSKLGKWALGGLVSAGLAAGGGVAAYKAHEASQAEFEATQSQIAPVIEDAMVDINRQTLEQQRTHPGDLFVITNPDGHMDVTKFASKAGNASVIMGNTDGKPDPNKPLYISYRNNTTTGEGTNGIRVVMTSPEGNEWVDEAMGGGFLGDTEDGWAASDGGADTTAQDFASSNETPLEAAQEVAETAQELKPYDPYLT